MATLERVAIYINNAGTISEISNCVFTNNHAGVNGGALLVADQGSIGVINASTFSANTAETMAEPLSLEEEKINFCQINYQHFFTA